MKDTPTYSAALPVSVHSALETHLLRSDGQEDLCFALWYPSKGRSRTTALLQKIILPRKGERRVHGNASFLPPYFERALGEATAAGAGLAFLHSHLGPGWQGMSDDDVRAEQKHAPAATGATGMPLVGLTLGTDGAWSARFWERTGPRKYERKWCTHVRVVGERLSVTYNDRLMPPPPLKEEQRRTVSSWGRGAQEDLARLRVGIVGAGNVGSIVAEALARTGVARITLIDFDTVETVNLDRLLHATRRHALMRWPKVRSLGHGLKLSATADAFCVDELENSIAEEDGFRAALDCDILFSCVDRPWGRSILNFIAYAHLLPVVDGGIQVETKGEAGLRRADWKTHIASPDRRCLECLGQYNAGLVSAEREGYFDDPKYIAGLPADHPVRRNENVFAFGLSAASFEVLQMLMMVIAPFGIANAGAQMYHFVPGLLDEPRFEPCNENCPYPGLIARGDSTGLVLTALHKKAEEARMGRARDTQLWRARLIESLEQISERLAAHWFH
jgi:molybdopterin-synthase adenylyltransferase